MSEPLLQLSQITKSFGAVRALRGVSFGLKAGEVHALLGENGAGKSTLIKIITGALQPDEGTIEFAGERIGHLTPAATHRLGIACIYQQPALFPDLSVAENISLRLEQHRAWQRVHWAERRTKAETLLREIGATIPPDKEVAQLSMPEQQLVEIACAIGRGARVIIMDEPTASLTQAEQTLLFKIVCDLRQSGVGLIYISHRLDEIFQLADRVTVLRDGQSVGTRLIRTRSSEEGAKSSGPLGLTESELIKLMVGREMSEAFPGGTGADQTVNPRIVLSLRGISCIASGVHDVNLDLHAGEILGLAGLIGSGRTELARVLFGITPATSGDLLLNGQLVTIHSPQKALAWGIAYVPEDRRRHGVILEMPIAANIAMAIHSRIFKDGWLRFDAERGLAMEYIEGLQIHTPGPDVPAASLSGGNQQKVSIARWLAAKPKLLILDEPTQGVDVGAKSEIHKIIRNLASEGMAVLMISSDLPEVLAVSNRIGVMRGGRLAAILPGRCEAHEIMAAALGQNGKLLA